MRSRSNVVLVALLALFASVVTAGCSSETEPSDTEDVTPPAAPDDEDLPPDLGEGDVADARVFDAAKALPPDVGPGDAVRFANADLIVPSRGMGVAISIELEDGTSEEATLSVGEDGTITTHSGSDLAVVAEASAASTSRTASPGPCRDVAHHLEGSKWSKPYVWYFRAGTTPSTNRKSNVETAFRRAATNIAEGRNDCGMTSTLSSAHTYAGRTSKGSNVISTATRVRCGTPDGVNVVGFGPLPRPLLGITCFWFGAGGEAQEADVKLDDHRAHWFATRSVPAGCRGAFSVEAVATHEMGHVFGLAHVSEAAHGKLTMSTAAEACSLGAASLGRGDVLGLRALY